MRLLSGDARLAVFAPLDESLVRSEAVVRRLGSAIALGLIADGEQLPAESELASSLNVSTMTLRDALADLRRRGLVTTRRGRGGGSFVCADEEAISGLFQVRLEELGPSDLRERGDLHAAIAGAAARLAAARASEHEISRLQEILERLEEAEATTARRRLDARFYVEMAACSQSVRLTMAEIEMQTEAGQLPWPAGGSRGRLDEVVAGHRSVLEAIVERRGDLARTRMEQNLAVETAWLVGLHMGLVTGAGHAELSDVRAEPSRRAAAR